jgi:hypothetical protein
MADIEMYGGSGFHMEHSEEGAAQKDGHPGGIEMYGGSDFHMSNMPIGSAQKDDGMKGIEMYGGSEFHLDHRQAVQAYQAKKPVDKGTEEQ